MNIEFFIERKKYLEEATEKLRHEISDYPPGQLAIYEQNGYAKWQVIGASKSGQKQYIKKSNRERAELMAQKKLDCMKLADLENELHSINMYLDTRKVPDWNSLLSDNSHYKELLVKKDNWENEPYKQKQGFEKYKQTPAPKDQFVRSKSEAMIAYCLYRYNIPYHYEEEYEFNGIKIAPDFTIKHPKTEQIYIWEHFGRAEQKKYQGDFLSKLPIYLDSGFIPGKNFIMTFETHDDQISILKVEQIVQETFLN